MATTADMLAEVPIFALLDDTERSTLADRVDIETHATGGLLFSVGDPGDSLYVVTRGSIELFVTKDTGEKVVLENAKRGDFFDKDAHGSEPRGRSLGSPAKVTEAARMSCKVLPVCNRQTTAQACPEVWASRGSARWPAANAKARIE